MAARSTSVFSRELTLAAVRVSFPKLDPRLQLKNPVMFIVELGSVITTGIFVLDLARGHTGSLWFVGVIAVWLWLTVLFANFAEAIAEGRGKAQAASLRATRTTTNARLRDGGEVAAADVPPAASAIPRANVFRDDTPEPSLPHDAALSNAPVEQDGRFRVPKIAETGS